MNANFFRELPDYGGGNEKKRNGVVDESWGTTTPSFRRDANTSVAHSPRCLEWDLPFSRHARLRLETGMKKSLIIDKI